MIALLEFWELDRGSIQGETLVVTVHLFIFRERIGETPHICLRSPKCGHRGKGRETVNVPVTVFVP